MPEELAFHAYCLMWPPMDEEEFASLKEHIRLNGQQTLGLTLDGKIIDGRHRALACRELGIEFESEEWDGDPDRLLDYLIGENLERRHLSQSQRAMIALAIEKEILENTKRRKPGPKDASEQLHGKIDKELSGSRDKAAAIAGVSSTYVGDAKKIASASPEVADKVRSGKLTIPEAKKELGLDKPKANGKAVEWQQTGKEEGSHEWTQADEKEDLEQKAAKEDEDSDEEWLADLPLSKILTGVPLKKFRHDALLYRHMSRERDRWRRVLMTEVNKGKSNEHGPYTFRIVQPLRIPDPRGWNCCPETKNGGCAGKGTVELIGKCKKCHGAGFWFAGYASRADNL